MYICAYVCKYYNIEIVEEKQNDEKEEEAAASAQEELVGISLFAASINIYKIILNWR